MSSSLRDMLKGWAYSVTGVVEGFWDVRYIPRTDIGVSDYFSQRPAL